MPQSSPGAPRLSAGAVVVRQALEERLYLMLRAYRNWDFPKGIVEPGEDPLAAARREVAEETGIEDLRFPWGEVYCETAPYARNKVARYYLAETRTEQVRLLPTEELGRPEHHEWRWLSHAAALALAPPRLQPILRWAAEAIGRGKAAVPPP
ncbi:MAG TPA: NUDIX domain-containing protein [Steroidobacteraceae bacterium]|nr:NUDIX domain-containing protein [Steroidobacteraceae bacterium]